MVLAGAGRVITVPTGWVMVMAVTITASADTVMDWEAMAMADTVMALVVMVTGWAGYGMATD